MGGFGHMGGWRGCSQMGGVVAWRMERVWLHGGWRRVTWQMDRWERNGCGHLGVERVWLHGRVEGVWSCEGVEEVAWRMERVWLHGRMKGVWSHGDVGMQKCFFLFN